MRWAKPAARWPTSSASSSSCNPIATSTCAIPRSRPRPSNAVQLQNYRSFLDRLGEALRQHLKNLDAARAEYERRRVLWSEKRIEAESLGRVVDRFRKEEQHAADRREQREGDDAALRISLAAADTGNH